MQQQQFTMILISQITSMITTTTIIKNMRNESYNNWKKTSGGRKWEE